MQGSPGQLNQPRKQDFKKIARIMMNKMGRSAAEKNAAILLNYAQELATDEEYIDEDEEDIDIDEDEEVGDGGRVRFRRREIAMESG